MKQQIKLCSLYNEVNHKNKGNKYVKTDLYILVFLYISPFETKDTCLGVEIYCLYIDCESCPHSTAGRRPCRRFILDLPYSRASDDISFGY